MATQLFPFFQLPSELRVEIYRYLLIDPILESVIINESGIGWIGALPDLTLLRANSRMYFEGLPIAYQSVEFIFPSPEAATTFLQKIGQLARGAIQHITLQIDETVTESAPIIEAFQWIVSCESLATLRVPRFWDEVWPFGPLLSVLEKETGLQQLKRLKTVEVELPGGDRELSEGLKTILTKPL